MTQLKNFRENGELKTALNLLTFQLLVVKCFVFRPGRYYKDECQSLLTSAFDYDTDNELVSMQVCRVCAMCNAQLYLVS